MVTAAQASRVLATQAFNRTPSIMHARSAIVHPLSLSTGSAVVLGRAPRGRREEGGDAGGPRRSPCSRALARPRKQAVFHQQAARRSQGGWGAQKRRRKAAAVTAAQAFEKRWRCNHPHAPHHHSLALTSLNRLRGDLGEGGGAEEEEGAVVTRERHRQCAEEALAYLRMFEGDVYKYTKFEIDYVHSLSMGSCCVHASMYVL